MLHKAILKILCPVPSSLILSVEPQKPAAGHRYGTQLWTGPSGSSPGKQDKRVCTLQVSRPNPAVMEANVSGPLDKGIGACCLV